MKAATPAKGTREPVAAAANTRASLPTPAAEAGLAAQQPTGNRAAAEQLAPRADAGEDEALAGPVWLLEDDAPAPGRGQMRRSEFLGALRDAVCATTDEGLAGTGRDSRGCPYIDFWFGHYAGQSVAHLERALRRFAPETARARGPQERVELLAARVRLSIDRWARSGEITGLPADVPLGLPGAATLMFRARPGGAVEADPEPVRRRLGPGRPLEAGLRARLEPAFGTSFAHVRAHTHAEAGRLAGELNAQAFTLGEHVAFGTGQYRPGTLAGEALIAHELAHVRQQARGPGVACAPDARALEAEADAAAETALGAAWLPGRAGPPPGASPAGGLRLSRCSSGPSLRDPQQVLNAYNAARRDLLPLLPPQGQLRDEVEIYLSPAEPGAPAQSLWGMFQYKLAEAGRDTSRQAAAQQWLIDQLERLRGGLRLQLEMSARYGFDFSAAPSEAERSQRGRFFTVTLWSAAELRQVDTILSRIPRAYLANVRHFVRQAYDRDSSSAAASWNQRQGTVTVYDPLFDSSVSAEERARHLVHELGHSLEVERTVGGFQHLPSPLWMSLSDWRTSTRATLAADLGFSGDAARQALQQLDQARSAYVGFPHALRLGSRMVVPDRYEGLMGSNQFLHYAAARDEEFVSPYARSHPADDLAESFAHFVFHPERTRALLDRGGTGRMNKWRYLQELAARQQAGPGAQPGAGRALGAPPPESPGGQARPEPRREGRP